MASTPPAELADELSQEATEAPPASEGALERLTAMAEELRDTDLKIEDAEVELKRLRARRNALVSQDMVDVMLEVGVDEFRVGNRGYILSDFCHASIQEDSRDEAHDWLEQGGYGDLIKYTVTATFGRNSQAQVKQLEAAARKLKADVKVKREVPWARLTSWVKEEHARRVREGLPQLPMQLLGAVVGRVVKVAERHG